MHHLDLLPSFWLVEADTIHNYHVYIMASRSGVRYTGITNDVYRRAGEHAEGVPGSFTARYRAKKLVYFEEFDDDSRAIAREKQIKAFRRQKKLALIESLHPAWLDLVRDHWTGME